MQTDVTSSRQSWVWVAWFPLGRSSWTWLQNNTRSKSVLFEITINKHTGRSLQKEFPEGGFPWGNVSVVPFWWILHISVAVALITTEVSDKSSISLIFHFFFSFFFFLWTWISFDVKSATTISILKIWFCGARVGSEVRGYFFSEAISNVFREKGQGHAKSVNFGLNWFQGLRMPPGNQPTHYSVEPTHFWWILCQSQLNRVYFEKKLNRKASYSFANFNRRQF